MGGKAAGAEAKVDSSRATSIAESRPPSEAQRDTTSLPPSHETPATAMAPAREASRGKSLAAKAEGAGQARKGPQDPSREKASQVASQTKEDSTPQPQEDTTSGVAQVEKDSRRRSPAKVAEGGTPVSKDSLLESPPIAVEKSSCQQNDSSRPSPATLTEGAAPASQSSSPQSCATSAEEAIQGKKDSLRQSRVAGTEGATQTRKDSPSPPRKTSATGPTPPIPPKKHSPPGSRLNVAGDPGQGTAESSAPETRTPLNPLALIRKVACNVASLQQLQQFEQRLLHDTDNFREIVKQQKDLYHEQSAHSKRDRMYAAMIRVLVDNQRLPPHGPPLEVGGVPDVLGAGDSALRQTPQERRSEQITPPSRAAVQSRLLESILHTVVSGKPTDSEVHMFRNQLVHNDAFHHLASRIQHAHSSLPSQMDQEKASLLAKELELCEAKRVEVQRKASERELQSAQGGSDGTASSDGTTSSDERASDGSASGGRSSGGSMSTSDDQAGRPQARRNSATARQPSACTRRGHALQQVSLMELVANGTANSDQLRWYARKFRSSVDYQREVLAEEQRHRAQHTPSGYTKAILLRLAIGRSNRSLMDRFPEDRRMDESCGIEFLGMSAPSSVAAARAQAHSLAFTGAPRQISRANAPFRANSVPPRRASQVSANAPGEVNRAGSTSQTGSTDRPLRREAV